MLKKVKYRQSLVCLDQVTLDSLDLHNPSVGISWLTHSFHPHTVNTLLVLAFAIFRPALSVLIWQINYTWSPPAGLFFLSALSGAHRGCFLSKVPACQTGGRGLKMTKARNRLCVSVCVCSRRGGGRINAQPMICNASVLRSNGDSTLASIRPNNTEY